MPLIIAVPIYILIGTLAFWFIGIFWNPFDKKKKNVYGGYASKFKRGKNVIQQGQADRRAREADMDERAKLRSSGMGLHQVANTMAKRQQGKNK